MRSKRLLILSVVFVLMLNFTSITIYGQQAEYYEIPTVEDLQQMDLRTPCNLTEGQLEKGLLGELSPLAYKYLEMEEKHGINAVFQAAIDATESGWGNHCFKDNNISGFYTDKIFEDKESCIEFVSQKRSDWYLTPPYEEEDFIDNYFYEYYYEDCIIGQYFNGYTMYDMSIKYNPNPTDIGTINYEYSDYVINIAYEIYVRALEE